MTTKLFRIGEYACFGKWRVTIKKDTVTLTGIDYFTNKVKDEVWFNLENDKIYLLNQVELYLDEMMSSGWADTITKWVESKLPDRESFVRV